MTTASVQPELLPVGPVEVQRLDTREAWLEARRQGIGASDAAAVMNLSPYKSAFQLYAEKAGLATPEPLEIEAAEWGLLLEPVLAEKYQQVTGRALTRTPLTLLRSRRQPFMVLSPDGFVDDPQRGPGIVEFKNVSAWAADEWADEPPVAFLIQLQHAMYVADVAWGSLAPLFGGQRFRYYDVERNDRFLRGLVEREAEFWERVQRRQAPDVDGSAHTAEVLRQLYPTPTEGEIVTLDLATAAWAERYEQAKAEKRRWEEAEREAKNHLVAAIGAAEAGVLPDGTLYTYKLVQKKGHTVAPTSYRDLRRRTA